MQTQTHETHSSSRGKHREGKVAEAIEQQTAKLPSDLFLWTAGAAMAASLVSQVVNMGSKRAAPTSTFIGQWVPTLLLLGLYNKIVKLQGSQPEAD